MGKVIFFPTLYVPPDEIKRKLEWYQEHYEIYQRELAYKSKGLSKGELYLYKERSHNAVRDTWKLYQGFLEIEKQA